MYSFVLSSLTLGGPILLFGLRQVLPEKTNGPAGRGGDRLKALGQSLAGGIEGAGRRFEGDVEHGWNVDRRDQHPALADGLLYVLRSGL